MAKSGVWGRHKINDVSCWKQPTKINSNDLPPNPRSILCLVKKNFILDHVRFNHNSLGSWWFYSSMSCVVG